MDGISQQLSRSIKQTCMMNYKKHNNGGWHAKWLQSELRDVLSTLSTEG